MKYAKYHKSQEGLYSNFCSCHITLATNTLISYKQ